MFEENDDNIHWIELHYKTSMSYTMMLGPNGKTINKRIQARDFFMEKREIVKNLISKSQKTVQRLGKKFPYTSTKAKKNCKNFVNQTHF